MTNISFSKDQQTKKQPKVQLTDKQRYELKLLQVKEQKKKQIERLKLVRDNQVKKAKAPSLSKHLKATQTIFNTYIKLRDRNLPCISCVKSVSSIWDAGHFWTQGEHGALRFHEDNCHKQCRGCNHWKSGNLNEYRLNLLTKVGKQKVAYLDAHCHDKKKWTHEELDAIQQDMKKRIKELEAYPKDFEVVDKVGQQKYRNNNIKVEITPYKNY